jgi:hypothetical protein
MQRKKSSDDEYVDTENATEEAEPSDNNNDDDSTSATTIRTSSKYFQETSPRAAELTEAIKRAKNKKKKKKKSKTKEKQNGEPLAECVILSDQVITEEIVNSGTIDEEFYAWYADLQSSQSTQPDTTKATIEIAT